MREKFQRFMAGRYGIDSLNKFLLGTALVLCVVNIIFRKEIFNILLLLDMVLIYIRMLSKNHSKRYQENVKFMQLKNKFLLIFNRKKHNFEDRKANHIYACPSCKQKIRIPKGRGHISITCPKCHTQFEKRS